MKKTFSFREYAFVNGSWQPIVILNKVSSSEKLKMINLLKKRDGYSYDRKLRCYVRYENGLIHNLVFIRKPIII